MILEPSVDTVPADDGSVAELQLGAGAAGKGKERAKQKVGSVKRAAATTAGGGRVTRSRAAVVQDEEAEPSKKRQRTKAPVTSPSQPEGKIGTSSRSKAAGQSHPGTESAPGIADAASVVEGARAMEQLASAAIVQDFDSQSNPQPSPHIPQLPPSLLPYPIGRTPFRYPCHHPTLPPPPPGDPKAATFKRFDLSLDYDSDDSSVSAQSASEVAGLGRQGRDGRVYPTTSLPSPNLLPTPSQSPYLPPHQPPQHLVSDLGHHLPSSFEASQPVQGQWQDTVPQTFSQEEVEANANAAYESISALLSASEYPGGSHG
ncbi:hypothetical protein IAR50_007012 [Cryptococcus sp. DSM 104548]